jgi:hypothetical protein
MGEFKLVIRLANDAMQSPGDVAAALRKLAVKLDGEESLTPGWDGGKVMDVLGNSVGEWEVA